MTHLFHWYRHTVADIRVETDVAVQQVLRLQHIATLAVLTEFALHTPMRTTFRPSVTFSYLIQVHWHTVGLHVEGNQLSPHVPQG